MKYISVLYHFHVIHTTCCKPLVNPRRACAKSHLTLEASLRPENAVTYSAGDEGQKFVAFSLQLLRCRDRALPPLDGHTYDGPFFLRITHMRIVHTKVRGVMLGFHAVSSPCVLYSFTMIILGLESSS